MTPKRRERDESQKRVGRFHQLTNAPPHVHRAVGRAGRVVDALGVLGKNVARAAKSRAATMPSNSALARVTAFGRTRRCTGAFGCAPAVSASKRASASARAVRRRRFRDPVTRPSGPKTVSVHTVRSNAPPPSRQMPELVVLRTNPFGSSASTSSMRKRTSSATAWNDPASLSTSSRERVPYPTVRWSTSS